MASRIRGAAAMLNWNTGKAGDSTRGIIPPFPDFEEPQRHATSSNGSPPRGIIPPFPEFGENQGHTTSSNGSPPRGIIPPFPAARGPYLHLPESLSGIEYLTSMAQSRSPLVNPHPPLSVTAKGWEPGLDRLSLPRPLCLSLEAVGRTGRALRYLPLQQVRALTLAAAEAVSAQEWVSGRGWGVGRRGVLRCLKTH